MARIYSADVHIFENHRHKRDKNVELKTFKKFEFISPVVVKEFHLGDNWKIIENSGNLTFQKKSGEIYETKFVIK